MEHKLTEKQDTQKRKLKSLIKIQKGQKRMEKSGNSPPFNDALLVKNLSSEHFTTCERILLEKGLNFALEPRKIPLEDIVADIEIGIWNLPNEAKDEIRIESKEAIEKYVSTSVNNNHKKATFYHQAVKSLREKDCFYLKADKGNTVVIMDKVDYYDRVNKLIIEGPYDKLDKNPLSAMEAEVEKFLRRYENHFDDPRWRLKLKVSNPRIPRLYALPKIHKPGNQVRPICSNIGAPTSEISKWLVKEFNNLTQPIGSYVTNNYEFIEKVKNIKLSDDEILVSFDVQALFPSVPITEMEIFLMEWLSTQNIEIWRMEMYVDLAKLCMKQNIFIFNGEFFRQSEGTSMGNSLSPFIANLFMCFFENKIKNDPNFPRIWIRYVDDIFAVQKKGKIQSTLNLLNNQYDSIKFSHEIESEGKLPFLDLMIIKNNGELEFDIYRKPTHTPRYTPSDSFHSFKQKYAAFQSMIHRMYSIPLNEERRQIEKKYILDLADFNGLKKQYIINMMEKKAWEIYFKNETTLSSIDDKGKRFIKLNYYPAITQKLNPVLKKYNLTVSYSSRYKLKNLLGSVKDKIDNIDKSGIYKIECNGCKKFYIGMTKRKIKQRLQDHVTDLRNFKETTALAKHVKEENSALGRGRRNQKQHGITPENIKIMKEIYNYKELCVWESIKILQNKTNALNDNNGLSESSLTKLFLKINNSS